MNAAPRLIRSQGRRYWLLADGRTLPVISGGDGPLPDVSTLLGRLNDLDGLDDEALAMLEADLLDAFDRLRPDAQTPEAIQALQQLADGVDAIRTVQGQRQAAAEQIAQQLADLDARVRPEPPAAVPDPDQPRAGAPAPAADDAPAPAPAAAAPAQIPVGAATSAQRVPALDALTRRRPAAGAPTPAAEAAARQRFFELSNPDHALTNLNDVAQLMVDRHRTFAGMAGGAREQVAIARIETPFPEDRRLGADPMRNAEIIEAVLRPGGQPITATGGICAPVNISYALPVWASNAMPFRQAFPTFNSDRGGILFMTPPDFSAFRNAITYWSEATDTSPGASTKACLTVPCPAQTEVDVAAIVQCLQMGNMGYRTFPEWVRNATENTLVAHSELREKKLIDQVKAASVKINNSKKLGFIADWLYDVEVLAAGIRNRRRMLADATLNVAAPAWARNALRGDLVRGPKWDPSYMAVADATIDQWFSTRNLRPVWYLDTPSTGTTQIFNTPTALLEIPDYPDTLQWGMWHEGAFLLIENGTLDLGLVRDSTLNKTNDLQTFSEVFETLAFVGLESVWVNSTVCPSGSYTVPNAGTIPGCGGQTVPGS